MYQGTIRFRDTFVFRGGGETVRAFSIFGLLLATLIFIVVQLAFRELSLQVLTERIDLGRSEALRIAATVEQVGQTPGGIDFGRIQRNRRELIGYIRERVSRSVFISFVEIRDRFGVRQILVRGLTPAPPPEGWDLSVPEDWPVAKEQLVRVPLLQSEGEVRVGVSREPMLEELRVLQRSLRIKVALAAALALAVLVSGFFYVLHLLRKNRRLEKARQSADRASYVGMLASNLAHEIRNPLNAMNMNLQMLEEDLRPAGLHEGDFVELLESTKQEIKRLEQLVNNFLTFARPAQPRFESTDLNQIVHDVIRFLEADFRQSAVEVRTDLAQLLPTTEIDQTLFKQALMNLMVNARQVLKENGLITIRTRAGAGGEAVLEVSDNGPGIPSEAQERIFDVFFSRRGGGTGLGLPIAKQIIERHGGTIELHSVEGRGTTFRIRLPRHHRPARVTTGPPQSKA
jgi:signal transduction histidine kinase